MSKYMANENHCPPSTSSTMRSPSSPLSPTDSDFPLTPRSSSSTSFAHNTRVSRKRGQREESSYEYPFEHCNGLVEVIREDEDHIDVEAEERAYCAFDLDESDASALGLGLRNGRAKRVTRPMPTHSRAPSSVFSGDIWVGANGEAEKEASFARGVRIVGWTSVGDKQGGAYVVYDCAILTHALTTIHVHKRYSAFLSLHSTLQAYLPESARRDVPPLPPRTAWARFRPGFLESRRKALQGWLSGVLLHPEIGGCAAVRQWVMAG